MTKYSKDIYNMYFEEYKKNKIIEKENKNLKLDLYCLQSDFDKYKKEADIKLTAANDEINRLKDELDKYKQNENAKIEAESKLDPDVLKGIFDLATEKCYFSNVAEGEKTKKVLLAKKSIKYWVEYTETIEIKVDLTKSKFGQKNNNNKTYVVYIPEAEVDINSATIDENGTNVYVEKQGIIKVSVTAKDIEEAIKEANEDTIKNLKDKDDILYKAREKAKDYVKAYIKAFDIEDKFNVELFAIFTK